MSSFPVPDSVDHRVGAVFVLLGVTLLASSVLLGLTGLDDTYRHDVREGSANVGESGVVIHGSDLSPEAQAVVLEAVTSDSPVWTGDPIGTQFTYPETDDGVQYYVELGGTVYLVETAAETRPVSMLVSGVRVSLALSGILSLFAGGAPILLSTFAPDAVLSRPFDVLFVTGPPVWALTMLAPAGGLALVYLVVFETVVAVPLNLFVTPMVLATAVCTAVTYLLLRHATLPGPLVLGSAVNVPILWGTTVALVVAPGPGETRAVLVVLVIVTTLSVIAGQVLGWYAHRWLELRRSAYPNANTYRRM